MSDHDQCHRALDEAKREAKYLRRYLDCGQGGPGGPCAGPMAGDAECAKHALVKAERNTEIAWFEFYKLKNERDEAIRERDEARDRIAKLEGEVESATARENAAHDTLAMFRRSEGQFDLVPVSRHSLYTLHSMCSSAERERDEARAMLSAICSEFERAVAHAEWRAAGSRGMSVPFTGDFANAAQFPSTVGRMRWWAREMRRVIGGAP